MTCLTLFFPYLVANRVLCLYVYLDGGQALYILLRSQMLLGVFGYCKRSIFLCCFRITPIHRPLHLSIYLSIHFSIFLSTVYLSIYLSISSLFIYLFIVFLSIYPSLSEVVPNIFHLFLQSQSSIDLAILSSLKVHNQVNIYYHDCMFRKSNIFLSQAGNVERRSQHPRLLWQYSSAPSSTTQCSRLRRCITHVWTMTSPLSAPLSSENDRDSRQF